MDLPTLFHLISIPEREANLMRKVKVAATQMSCSWDAKETLDKAERLVREAAAKGAQIILQQELFEHPYFCQHHNFDYLELSTPLDENPAVNRFQQVAAELKVVIPVCFYERAGNKAFNSVAMIDADGSILGIYRKTHIPDGVPYAEKFYFTPGDTGFLVWNTAYAKIGLGICWDQWFPETARCLALKGAEMLLFPTAIGNELYLPFDSKDHWQRCMQGHAAANVMPVIASNRIGTERDEVNDTTAIVIVMRIRALVDISAPRVLRRVITVRIETKEVPPLDITIERGVTVEDILF